MDLPQHWLAEVETFFETYKALEEKTTATGGWKGAAAALEVLKRRSRPRSQESGVSGQ
jgi:inorganic pyrophosphatase